MSIFGAADSYLSRLDNPEISSRYAMFKERFNEVCHTDVVIALIRATAVFHPICPTTSETCRLGTALLPLFVFQRLKGYQRKEFRLKDNMSDTSSVISASFEEENRVLREQLASLHAQLQQQKTMVDSLYAVY